MWIIQQKTGNSAETLSRIFATLRLCCLVAFVALLCPLVVLPAFGQAAKPGAPAGIEYVSPEGSNSNNGSTWATAKATVAAAVAGLPADRENGGHGKVYLAAGTYQITSTLVLPAGTIIEGLAGSSSPTIIKASPSFQPNTPLVALGSGGQPEGVQLRDVAVDCNDIPGAIGVRNAHAQENSGLNDVSIINCPGIGLDVAPSSSGGGQGSFYTNIRSVYSSACRNCSTSTVPVKLGVAPKYIKGLTIDARDAPVHPSVGLVGAKTTSLSNAHCEGVTTCFEVGSGTVIQDLDCGGGSLAAAVTTCVRINEGSNGVGVYGLNADANLTNLLIDPSRSVVVPSTVNSLPLYVVGSGANGSQVVLSSDHNLPFYGAKYLLTNGNYFVSAGRIALAAGAGSHTFAAAYSVAPACIATDETRDLPVRVRSTARAIYVTGTGNDVVMWVCTPAAN